MAYYPPKEDTIHFVGGIGTKADRAELNGGGCTQVAWDGSGVLSDFMGANSGPVTNAVNATYDHTGGAAEHMVSAVGIGTGVTVGTLAYLSGTNISTGVYEITSIAGDGSWVAFADIDATGDNTDTTINVGGALDTLQNASDNPSTDAAAVPLPPPPAVYANRTIYTNLNENLAAAIDIDMGGGSITNNTKKKIVGFNTVPGDMDKGGSYYQGPLDAYINGVDTSKCITCDAQDNAIDVFAVNCQDNVEFRNIRFYNTDGLSGNNGVEFSTSPVGIKFVNCKFADVWRGINGVAEAVAVHDCYGHSTVAQNFIDLQAGSVGFTAIGCVSNAAGSHVRLYSGGTVIGNVFIDAFQGIIMIGGLLVACFNTFYNQTLQCIRVNGTTSVLIEYNNIFMPAAVDDYAVYIDDDKGTILYSDYSWAFCSAGNFTVDPWYDDTNDKSFMGPNSTKDIDPQLVDAANGDLRPLNPAVLRGGRPDIAGNPGQIGAVTQKYQFAQRARQVNQGRLAIIR